MNALKRTIFNFQALFPFLFIGFVVAVYAKDYGENWVFDRGVPKFLIDEHGNYPNGMPANPMDVKFQRSGGSRSFWFFTYGVFIGVPTYVLISALRHRRKKRRLLKRCPRCHA